MTFLALTQAAQALLDSIETDEGGQVGKSGNGGLLSRKTLILAGQLRAELLRTLSISTRLDAESLMNLPPFDHPKPGQEDNHG